MKICYEEFKKLPFVDNVPNNKGLINASFFDEKKGCLQGYMINENNKFVIFKSEGLLKGFYWSKKVIAPKKDIYIQILHLLSNKLSFYELINFIVAIEQDIHNFGAILHKQFILWEYIKKRDDYPILQDLYITEIEYLMGVIRSFFDLIYEVLIQILSLSKHNLSELPKSLGSFSDRTFKRSKQNGETLFEFLKSAYGFNDAFADFFNDILPLFRLCRKMRDSIYHRGKTPQIIYITKKGPAIGMRKTESGYKDPFYDFRKFFEDDNNFSENLLDNDLVSLFYFINRIIDFTLKSSDKFADALLQSLMMPKGISYHYHIFLRGPEIEYLNKIPSYIEQNWLNPIEESFEK